MKRLLAVTIALVAAVVTLFVLPLGAGASSDKRFVLSWRGAFTGETTGAGTFAVGGALSDSGTFDATFALAPGKDNCELVTSDETFTAPDGSFTFHIKGRSCSSSPSDPRAVFDGRFAITGGTGTYAGLSGKGTITSLADFTDGTFTGVHDGTAHFAH